MTMQLRPGVEIIPEFFADEPLSDESYVAKTEIVGEGPNPEELRDLSAQPTGFSLAPSPTDNALAAAAFEKASAEFAKLPHDRRRNVVLGDLAIKYFNNMKSAQARSRQVPTPSNTADELLGMAKKIGERRRKPKRKVKRASTPAPVNAGKLMVRAASNATGVKPNMDLTFLDIPGISVEAEAPDMILNLDWPERGELVRHVLLGHWCVLDRRDDGKPQQLVLVRDTRWKGLDALPVLAFQSDATMRVTLSGSEVAFEAVRGMFHVNFGIFELTILIPTGN